MRTGPTSEVLAGAVSWRPVVASWYGGTVLATDIPIMSGRVTASVTQQIPEQVTFTVPRLSTVDGALFDWCPYEDPLHPLARYGQTVTVQIVCASPSSGVSWSTRVGRYLISDWDEADNGAITVTAVGMLKRVSTDLLTTAVAPLSGGTLGSEFRRLLPGRFTVSVDAGLTDRACPKSFSWASDRLAALYDIADAWPARLRTSDDGYRLLLLPPLPATPGTPVLTLVDGARTRGPVNDQSPMAVVVSAPDSDTREGTYNRIIARSSATDLPANTTVQAVVDLPSGTLSPSGEYGPVTKEWSTPLATTVDTLAKSGQTWLANNAIPSRVSRVTIAPDPRIDLDDPLWVTSHDIDRLGWVVGYDMPLVVADAGDVMRVDVGVGL